MIDVLGDEYHLFLSLTQTMVANTAHTMTKQIK